MFERPIEGRSIVGVSAAVANYFNIPTGLVRAGFVISVFFGGLGFAAYIAGWVLIREEGEDESLVERWLSNAKSPSSWIGLGLVVLAIFLLVDSIQLFSGSTVFAGLLIVTGVLLYRGVFDDGVPSLGMMRRSPATARAVVVDDKTAQGTEDEGLDETVDEAQGTDGDQDLDRAHDELATDIPLVDAPADGGDGGTRRATVVGRPPRRRRQRSRLGRFTLAALLISVGSMAVADTADYVDFSASSYVAVALMVVGVGLAIGALFGRAYSLIFLGLILVGLVQLTSWFDIDLGGGFGDPVYRIETVEMVQDEYRLLAGEMVIDFTDLDFSTGSVNDVRTEVSLGAGQLVIEIPDDVNVVVDLRVVAGELNWPDGKVDGTSLDRVFERHPDGAIGEIVIDASVGFGQLDLNIEGR